MSREIKFRIWNGAKMLDVYGLNPMTQTAYVSHIQLTGKPGDDVLLPFYDPEDRGEEYDHGCRLIQYTGLKDKNGVEIYEGDIVRVDCNWDERGFASLKECPHQHIGQIIWGEGLSAGFSISPRQHWALAGEPHWVVIGNIWENPELVEQTAL